MSAHRRTLPRGFVSRLFGPGPRGGRNQSRSLRSNGPARLGAIRAARAAGGLRRSIPHLASYLQAARRRGGTRVRSYRRGGGLGIRTPWHPSLSGAVHVIHDTNSDGVQVIHEGSRGNVEGVYEGVAKSDAPITQGPLEAIRSLGEHVIGGLQDVGHLFGIN